MAKLLSKYEMDNMRCDAPVCHHDHSVIYLHPGCHPRKPVNVRYDKSVGQVIVSCSVCHDEVARFVPAIATVQ